MTLKPVFTIFLLCFVFVTCTGEETVLSYEDSLTEGECISGPHPFHVKEPCYFTIIAKCKGFDPVLVFYPSKDRGFEWDGARDGVLCYTGFFYGPETYNIHVRGIDGVEINDSGFTVTIVKPDVPYITPGKTITGNFQSESMEYAWYYEVLYYIRIDTPGEYTIKAEADAKIKCLIDGKKFIAMLRLGDTEKSETRNVKIEESGKYGIQVWYYEKKEGSYSFTIEKNED